MQMATMKPHIYHPWEYLNLSKYCLEEMFQIFMKMASIDITSLTRIYIQIASNVISSIAWNRSYSTGIFSFVSSQRMAAESARQPKREHLGTNCQSTPILSPSDLHVCGTISTNLCIPSKQYTGHPQGCMVRPPPPHSHLSLTALGGSSTLGPSLVETFLVALHWVSPSWCPCSPNISLTAMIECYLHP